MSMPGPSKPQVVMFTIWVVATLLLIIGAAVAAIVENQHQVTAASQQWCTTLDLLTRTPISKPGDPKANPSREASYELYLDFVHLRKQFGCS